MKYRCVSMVYKKDICDVTVAVDNGDGKEMIFNVSVLPVDASVIDVRYFAQMCVAMRLTGITDTGLKSATMDTALADALIIKG
jgi:hypothetical protein